MAAALEDAPPYGVLLFSDPSRFHLSNADRSALGALGDECAVYPDALADKPEGFWLTNAAYRLLREANLNRRPDIRCDDYLSTRVTGLLAEAGLRTAPAGQQARWLLVLYRRVMRYAVEHLGLAATPEGRTLATAIRRAFFRERDLSDLNPTVRYALESANQRVTYAGQAVDPLGEERAYILRHHRQTYAARMMSMQVPYGEWSQIEPPRDPAQALKWARDLLETRPLMVRAQVRFRGARAHELALLANMGSGAAAVMTDRGRIVNARPWLAGPEFLALAQLADVEILGAMAADRYGPNPWAAYEGYATCGPAGGAPMACGPLTLAGRTQMEYAAGIFVEALWQALVATSQPCASAVWINAHDRAACLLAAAELMTQPLDGVRVTGYARGRLWVRVSGADEDEAALAQVARSAVAARLVPPAMPVPPPASDRLEIANGLISRVHDQMDPGLLLAARNILGHETFAGAAA